MELPRLKSSTVTLIVVDPSVCGILTTTHSKIMNERPKRTYLFLLLSFLLRFLLLLLRLLGQGSSFGGCFRFFWHNES